MEVKIPSSRKEYFEYLREAGEAGAIGEDTITFLTLSKHIDDRFAQIAYKTIEVNKINLRQGKTFDYNNANSYIEHMEDVVRVLRSKAIAVFSETKILEIEGYTPTEDIGITYVEVWERVKKEYAKFNFKKTNAMFKTTQEQKIRDLTRERRNKLNDIAKYRLLKMKLLGTIK